MKLRCIIVDDEPLAIDLLKSYARQTPILDLVGTYASAIDAISMINTESIDLLFLDINMPNLNGLEFSRMIPPEIKVVFTTAYDQYAVEGFKVNALDYLLKPISYSDFMQATTKALQWFKMLNRQTNDSLYVKSGYRVERIEYKDILYIENQKDYVLFYIEGNKEPISSLMSLQVLASKLPTHLFMRVHRSFIVNLEKVKSIERNTIIFGKSYIPISDTYRNEFNQFVERRIL